MYFLYHINMRSKQVDVALAQTSRGSPLAIYGGQHGGCEILGGLVFGYRRTLSTDSTALDLCEYYVFDHWHGKSRSSSFVLIKLLGLSGDGFQGENSDKFITA